MSYASTPPSHEPKHVYKFMNSKFVDDFVKLGRMRIGTAEEYRKPDGKTGERQDPSESANNYEPGAGTHQLTKEHPLIKALYGREGPPWTDDGEEHVAIAEAGTKFIIVTHCLLFCTAWDITAGMRRRMLQQWQCDACVKISEPINFFHAVGRHPRLAIGRTGACDYVTYLDVDGRPDLVSENRVFEKGLQFQWQREWRCIWSVAKGETTAAPMIIDVPQVTPLLKRLF